MTEQKTNAKSVAEELAPKETAVKKTSKVKVELPVDSADVAGQIAGLTALVKQLQSDLKGNSAMRSRMTKHTKEHTARMREYHSEDGKKSGIVVEVSNVRRKPDPEGIRRFISVCNLEILNPKTEKTFTVEVNYVQFLQEAMVITVKIVNRKDITHIEERVGTRYVKSKDAKGNATENVGSNDFLFEVEFISQIYTLEVLQGEFIGESFENNGKGLNM